jgi:hypothetical protein
MVGLNEVAAAKLTVWVCSLVSRLHMVAPSEPWQSQSIRLPLPVCHRHSGLRKADACDWPVCTENLIRVDAVMESPKLAE